MKTHALILAAISLAILPACSLTDAQKQQITAHALKSGDAALLGLLTGGKEGAIASLRKEEIANIKERQKTAAKNPVTVAP